MNTLEKLPEGYDEYLKVCLDPYHDSSIRFEGAPTSRNAQTVTLCLNQEVTYSAADFGITTGDQWDAHFAMYPFIQAMDVLAGKETDGSTGFLNFGATPVPRLYPMSVHGVPNGDPTFMTTDYNIDIPNIQGLSNDALARYATGQTSTNGPGRRALRIVGEAFEVVDESPDIYSQGAVTVYRYPLDVTPANRIVRHAYAGFGTNTINPFGPSTDPFPGGVLSRSINCYDLRCPPSNTSVAVLVPGSKTWRAKEGAYVIGTQYASEVPFKTLDNSDFIFTGYTPTAGSAATGGSARYSFGSTSLTQSYQGGAPTILDTPDYSVYPNVNAAYPFNLSGAYFTGLSRQYASLRLRYRIYAEILADPGDNTLAPLASPALPYEQLLQEFCMRVIANQEAGVPQTMNPKGEKWRQVLKSIAHVAKVSSPMLDMVIPGLGSAVGAGGEALSAVSKVGQKKKKPSAANSTSQPKKGK